MTKRQKQLLIAGTSVIVLLGALVGGVILWKNDQKQRALSESSQPVIKHEPSTPQPSDNSLPFTTDNAQFLERALSSKDRKEQEKAVVPSLRGENWPTSVTLPPGASLTIDAHSFKKDKGNGIVTGEVTGIVSAEFDLYVTPAEGKWLVYNAKMK